MPSICSYGPTDPKLWFPNGDVGAPRSILVMRASAPETKPMNADAAVDTSRPLRMRLAENLSSLVDRNGNADAAPCIRFLHSVFLGLPYGPVSPSGLDRAHP